MRVTQCLHSLLLCGLAFTVEAGGYVNLNTSTGEEDYRSYAASTGFDLGESDWAANLDYFSADDGDSIQYGVGLEWNQSEIASWSLGASHTEDSQLEVDGYSLGGAWRLNQLWNSETGTHLDLGVGHEEYTPITQRALPDRIADAVPEMNRYSIGLSQDLGEIVSLSVGYDKYDYSENPEALALFLLRRVRTVNSALTVLSFPDNSSSAGLWWSLAENLSCDLSYSNTDTLANQELESTQLSLTWYPQETWSIGFALSHSHDSAVIGPRGGTAVEADSSDYVDMSVSLSF